MSRMSHRRRGTPYRRPRPLPQAGAEYLRHILSQDQLALYRVVARDAHRFPELGWRYQEATTGTAMPSSPAILIYGRTARAGSWRDKQTLPRCSRGC